METIFIHNLNLSIMKSHDNFATEGLSGSYKQVVFRQRYGTTVVGKRPKRKKDPTSSQLQVQASFTNAATYAKSITADAGNKAAYRAKAKPGQSAYNRAMSDFFHPPVIGEIDSSGYNGQVGSTLISTITDDFKVASVKVRIEKSDGSLIEEGAASILPDGLNWMYVSTVANGSTTGTTISFTAADMPGHSIVKSKTL